MKRTKELLNWIDDTTEKYCKHLDVDKPDIVYSYTAFIRKMQPYYTSRGFSHRKTSLIINNTLEYDNPTSMLWGAMHCELGIMFLNLSVHGKSITKLKDTIAHELCHLKYPLLEEGDEFINKIEYLLDKVKI